MTAKRAISFLAANVLALTSVFLSAGTLAYSGMAIPRRLWRLQQHDAAAAHRITPRSSCALRPTDLVSHFVK